ncbi:MAG: SMC-Scp complex subunit ScpB [Candidatus Omnitrophota bacterium]
MEREQAKKIIEALLFSSERPLNIEQVSGVIEQADLNIAELVNELKEEYAGQGRSFTVMEVAGGYQLTTRAEYAPWLSKMHSKANAEKLSRPALETLAIIAYRQPITRVEIEEIRGVNVDGVIKKLLEKSIIRITGRKQLPGRPFCYGTTNEFLELFGLHSLENLPRLEEFGELMKVSDAHVQTESPAAEDRSDRQENPKPAQ